MTDRDAGARTAPDGGRRSPGALLWARGLLLLAGAVTLLGGVYFTFFASEEDGGVANGLDWFLAACALALSVGYLVAGARLGSRPSPLAMRLTVAVVLAHLVFNVVKLVGYEEQEALTFFVVDVAILLLLALVRRPGRRTTG